MPNMSFRCYFLLRCERMKSASCTKPVRRKKPPAAYRLADTRKNAKKSGASKLVNLAAGHGGAGNNAP
jgi:hypothetical protein